MGTFKRRFIRVYLAGMALILSLVGFWGCAGRNIHLRSGPNPAYLVRQWTLPTREILSTSFRGSEYSNPIISENSLVFGNQSVGLVSIYPIINQRRWVLPVHNGVISELTIEQGFVYFGGGDGFLYSVNLENGRVSWKYELRNPMISRPTVSGGRVFVTTSDDTVYSFDAGTGKWLWHYRRRSSPTVTVLGASSPLVDGNEVIVGLSDGYLIALSLPDGQLKWEKKLHQGTKFTDVDAHPVIMDGVIYTPSYDGALYALKRQGGQILWRFDSGGSKTVTMDGTQLFLPSTDGTFYSLNKDNSKLNWKFELDGGTPTTAIVTENYVIFGSSFQYLYLLDKFNGKLLYRFNVGFGSGFSGSPTYDSAKQRVYFLSAYGNLYAFSVRKPTPRFASW